MIVEGKDWPWINGSVICPVRPIGTQWKKMMVAEEYEPNVQL